MARYGDAQSSLFLAGNHGRVSAVVCDCQNLYPALVDMPGAAAHWTIRIPHRIGPCVGSHTEFRAT